MLSSIRALASRGSTCGLVNLTTVCKSKNYTPSLLALNSTRKFASEAAEENTPTPVIEVIHPTSDKFVSNATREEAKGTYKNFPVSPRKLALICRMVRGLSVREAMVQLRLTHWKKAVYVRRAIRTITTYAIGNFNMNLNRLYLKEINCTKGTYYKRYDFKGRSRFGVRSRMHSHLTVTLAEQPYRKGEVRIGRYGRTIESWKHTDSMLRAFRQRKAGL